ncbi:hypothetical protein [Maritalea sp.]|uniref:hypothetical protein n=1 Tax=Maritalea sp. TaxID=2003361 RepID=UPI003EF78B55
MDRVLIDKNGLFVSKAGVDVKAATPDQLLFSSDNAQFLEYSRVGHPSPSQWQHLDKAGGGKAWYIDYDIPFPKSFLGVPLCMIFVSFGPHGDPFVNSKTYSNNTLGTLNLTTDSISISVLVHNDILHVQAGQVDAPSPFGFTVKYRLLEQTN